MEALSDGQCLDLVCAQQGEFCPHLEESGDYGAEASDADRAFLWLVVKLLQQQLQSLGTVPQ